MSITSRVSPFVFAVFALLWSVAGLSEAPSLQCVIGPVTKTYGSTKWLVYSCDDSKSIVIVSAPGSLAMPFYFTFFPEAGGYHLGGEGTGSKAATDAAYKDLEALAPKDVEALVRETKAVK